MTDRALLLDLDGTLADSLPALKQVYRTFLSRFGVGGTEEEFQSLNGPPLREVCRILQETHRLPGGLDELYSDYQRLLAQAHAEIPPAIGAENVLFTARMNGWATAVVTSTPRAVAKSWLDRHRLNGLIDFIIGGDDVVAGKPNPEPYSLALERAGCAAENAIAVEDSAKGATAALMAGVPTWLLSEQAPTALLAYANFRGCLPSLGAIVYLISE